MLRLAPLYVEFACCAVGVLQEAILSPDFPLLGAAVAAVKSENTKLNRPAHGIAERKYRMR